MCKKKIYYSFLTGIDYWDAEIQPDQKLSTSSYNDYMFTVGGGYVWNFGKNFYLNPWIASHIKIAGDKNVMVDGSKFDSPAFVPEVSLKVGWYFNTSKK